jgi:WD40 repeat protein/uncharacterized caspase-like protein
MFRNWLTGVALMICVAPICLEARAQRPTRELPAAEPPYKVIAVSRAVLPPPKAGPTPEVVVQSGHNGFVSCATFHPDGALLATASSDATVKLWDIRLGREVRTLLGADRPLYTVAFRPDGKQIAAAGADQTIFLWNVEDGRLTAVLKGHDGWVVDLAYSPSGQMLASACEDRNVILWDLEKNNPTQVLKHDDGVSRVAWSPDGKTLATQPSDSSINERIGKKVQLWDVAAGKVIKSLPIPDKKFGPYEMNFWRTKVGRLDFSSNGKHLLVTIDGATDDFDVGTGQRLRSLAGVFLGYRQQDGAVCLLPKVGTIQFVDPGSGKQLGVFTTKCAPDENTVRKNREFITGPRQWDAPSERSALSPDGKLLACPVQRGRIGIWDTRNGGLVLFLGERMGNTFAQLKGNLMRPLTVTWSPSAPVFAVADTDYVRVFDLRTGSAPLVFKAHHGFPALAFSPNGKVLATAGYGDKGIKLWDHGSGRLLATCDFAGLAGAVSILQFAPSGKALASGHWFLPGSKGDCRILVWDAATGKPRHVLSDDGPARLQDGFVVGAIKKISGLGFLEDDVVCSTHDCFNRLSLWDVKKGKQITAMVVNQTRINGLAVSPDGRGLAIAGGLHKEFMPKKNEDPGNSVRLIQSHGGKLQPFILKGHRQMVLAVAYSADSKLLASGSSDATIKLWDPGKKTLLTTLSGHTADVSALAFSHDGRYLVSASDDHSVCLWDVGTRKLVATFVGFGRDEFVLATPDGYYTASRQGLKAVAYRLGNRATPFDQFDLHFNRPDQVLERLGYASATLVQAYYNAYQKRLRRLKIREDALGKDCEQASLQLLARPPLSTDSRNLTVRLRASDAHHRLDRLLAFVNGVPVWGMAGADLRHLDASSADLEVPVELCPGANVVQLAVVNSQGTESLKQSFLTTCQKPAGKPDLYVVVVGVSDYVDERYRLTYADKDARDLADFFAGKRDRFRKVHILPILNRKATRENILKVRDLLDKSGVDDLVVLFLAGHGLLDKNLDYYFATADIDFREPAKRGLSYEAIEGLLDGIRARKKLLLMDTCHAGEVDKEDLKVGPAEKFAEGTVTARSFRGLDFVSRPRLGLPNSFQLLQELFADLRRGTGAVVIASAGGVEFALESDTWKNGVFTHALLRGLKGEARRDGAGPVRVSDLRDFVQREVQRLTGGRQAPTARAENLEQDFNID